MEYFIKKVIEAKSLSDAIAKESQAEILQIWTEDSHRKQLTPAIGFQVQHEEDIQSNNSMIC